MFIFKISDNLLKHRVFIYFINTLLLGLYMTVDYDISIPFFSAIWLILGNLIIKFSFKKEDSSNSQRIFNITFFIYLGYMLLTKLLYIENPFSNYFYVSDPASFYQRIYDLSQNSVYKGVGLLDITDRAVLDHGTAIYFLGWLIGRLSYFIGGINSPVIHNLVVVGCMSMINVFMYNTSRYFFDETKSKIIALSYGLFSYSLIYSSVLLRDQHVALLLVIGFYIILGTFSLKKLILLLILATITFTFRPTHGVFYILLIIFYLYVPLKKFRFLMITFSILVFFIFINFGLKSEYKNSLIDRSQTYSEFHDQRASSAGGAAKLYETLPKYLHPFTRMIQSQINPFSLLRISKAINDDGSIQYQYLSYTASIGDFLWFVIWFILLYGLFIKFVRKHIPNNLFFVFLISILLIILAGFSSYDNRRLLGVYPIIYLTAMLILFCFSKRVQFKIVNLAVITYIILGVSLNFIF